MRAAPVEEVHDPAVGGHLVAAHPEHLAQRSGHRHHESAVAADPFGGPCHRRSRTVVAVVPALGGLVAPDGTEHPPPAQTQLDGGVVDQGIAGGGESGRQARIVGQWGQEIPGPQIAGPHPLIPGQPRRREQRRRPGHQHDLADRGVIGSRVGGDDHRPLPAVVAGEHREETVRRRDVVIEADPEVIADGLTAELDHRRPGLLHRAGEDGRHLIRRRGRTTVVIRRRDGAEIAVGQGLHRDNIASPPDRRATPPRVRRFPGPDRGESSTCQADVA